MFPMIVIMKAAEMKFDSTNPFLMKTIARPQKAAAKMANITSIIASPAQATNVPVMREYKEVNRLMNLFILRDQV